MPSVTAFTTQGKRDFLDGVHLATDEYKLALYTSVANHGAGTTGYTVTAEVATGGGYTAGGVVLTGRTIGISGTVAHLTWNDAVWATATFTAASCLLYNNTKAGKNAIGVWDFGGDQTGGGGNFTVDLPATGTTALIRIG